jgi:hypothetical protein
MDEEENYRHTFAIVLKVLQGCKGERPLFGFPRDVALFFSLDDIGGKLARNDVARSFVPLVVRRCVERTGCHPTVLMLQIALDHLGIPVEECSLSELGLEAMIPQTS